jgi:hypothetical protein
VALCHELDSPAPSQPNLLTSILLTLARRPSLGPFLPHLDASHSHSAIFYNGVQPEAPSDTHACDRKVGGTKLAVLLRNVTQELCLMRTSEEVRGRMLARRTESITPAHGSGFGGSGASRFFGGPRRVAKSKAQREEELQREEERCASQLALLSSWSDGLSQATRPVPLPRQSPPQPAMVTLTTPIRPTVQDFALSRRELRQVAVEECRTSLTELASLATTPLRELTHSTSLVSHATRSELGLPSVSSTLGIAEQIDLLRHPDATSRVAKDMLSRLVADAADHAADATSATLPTLRLLAADAATNAASRSAGEEALVALIDRLEMERKASAAFVRRALRVVVHRANEIPLETEASPAADLRVRELERLRQLAASVPPVAPDLLMCALVSSRGAAEVTAINAFAHDADGTLDATVALLLHTSRQGTLNRAIVDATALLAQLRATGELDSTAVHIKSGALAASLLTARHFFDKSSDGDALSFDPRLLLFEFVHGIVLRRAQVALVSEFVSSVRTDKPLVRQMLMGGGKTTVVGPLLSLLLGELGLLVVQTMPSALLEQSQATLRSTFSSVVRKRVFTLAVDRSSRVDWKLAERMERARRCRGVVLCAAQSLKSLQLKLLETLAKLHAAKQENDVHPSAANEVRSCVSIVSLFRNGCLIMDEVV